MKAFRRRGRTGRLVALASGLIAGSLVFMSVASAHTSIYDSNPADGSTVEAAPAEVTVRFGMAEFQGQPIPPQPGQASDARLEVYDACGTRVDKDDSVYDNNDSSVTTTSGGEVAGRYEIHWYVTAADGEAQVGALDFVVSGGELCEQVVRPDADDDIDLGFNPTEVKSVVTSKGAEVTISLKDKAKCKSFAADAESKLQVVMDTNYDEEIDYTGVFECKINKKKKAVYKLMVTKTGDEEPSLKLKARKAGGKKLVVLVPSSLATEENAHIDLHLSSTTDSDKCTEDKVCVDRAPDLGWVRAH